MVSLPGQLDEAEISEERVLGLTEKPRPTVNVEASFYWQGGGLHKRRKWVEPQHPSLLPDCGFDVTISFMLLTPQLELTSPLCFPTMMNCTLKS